MKLKVLLHEHYIDKEEYMDSFIKFTHSTTYRLFLCCVIMPLNGYIMTDNFALGAVLTIAQIPYLLSQFNKEE